MWKVFFAFILVSSAAESSPLPWGDVVSSIVWLKMGSGFPATITSMGRDEVSFQVLNDQYVVTRGGPDYLIRRDSEVIHLPVETLEKTNLFVKAAKRGNAVLPEVEFRQSIRPVAPPVGHEVSRSIYQCKSDLPVRIRIDGLPVDQILKHTWLQNESSESFGMPFTDQGTYLGGLAHIRTPDSFIARKPRHLECSPVFFPQGESSESKASSRVACIARSLSLPQDPIFQGPVLKQNWVANLDYQVLDRNCLKAVRFVLACAGAKESQVVNAGIGGAFDWNEVASISLVQEKHLESIRQARQSLSELRSQTSIGDLAVKAEVLLNHAIQTDAEIRGEAKGSSISKTFREICALAQSDCNQDFNRSNSF